jgi:hypothetical protein
MIDTSLKQDEKHSQGSEMSEMGRKGILSRLMWNEELFKKLR